jgi:hypothetical protein
MPLFLHMKKEAIIHIVNPTQPNHWLNEPDYEWFKKAYLYASQKNQVIPILAKLTAEEVFYIFDALLDGLEDEIGPWKELRKHINH